MFRDRMAIGDSFCTIHLHTEQFTVIHAGNVSATRNVVMSLAVSMQPRPSCKYSIAIYIDE